MEHKEGSSRHRAPLRARVNRLSALGDFLRSLLHRLDVWGVALAVSLLALYLHDAARPLTLILAATVSVLYWLGYAVNDYFDAPFDERDPHKARTNFFVTHPVPRRTAATHFFFVSAGILGVFSLFGPAGWALFGLSVVVLWAYSAPPLRLKSRPGFDLITHALFGQTYAYVLCVVLIEASWTRLDGYVVAINLLASLSGQLAQQVRDFAVDSKTEGNFTTTVGMPLSMACLRGVTATLVVVSVIGFANGTVPLAFAPVAVAFLPATLYRLQGGRRCPSPRVIAFSTTFALLYVGALVAIGDLS